MARKPSNRGAKSRSQATPSAKPLQKFILGGVILVLVLAAGVAIRSWQQRNLPLRLQGALDNHYSKGVPGAPVVMKEFSDYT